MTPFLHAFARRTGLALASLCLATCFPAWAQAGGDEMVIQAREALRKKDKPALALAAQNTAGHPLAQWVAYWELSNRLDTASHAELDAFFSRWPNTYVEDRLRNDWLLELGRRRDWPAFAKEFPRFRMNDDREATCYWLLTQHLSQQQAGQAVRNAAREAWLAQRESDDGCQLMAATLLPAGVLTAQDAWAKARLSIETNRPRNARHAVGLLSPQLGATFGEALDNPARWLARRPPGLGQDGAEIATLALMRMAGNDPDAAAAQTQAQQASLPPALAALAWAQIGRLTAMKLRPDATQHYERALALSSAATPEQRARTAWSNDALQWMVRAALRAPLNAAQRQRLVQAGVDAMSEAEQREPTWLYWRARSALQIAPNGEPGQAQRLAARSQLETIATPLHFYGQLALETLGRPLQLPAVPAAPTVAERDAARQHPGLNRALHLITLGLRNEGVREWNFWLRFMTERELLAAAQRACDVAVWDRCINTSERTRTEVHVGQRYPTPWRERVLAQAGETGLDAAYVFGLIRQESRFVSDIRSHVGASGLMQLMPNTARWTAKRLGLPFTIDQITDPDTNLKLGNTYLKLVLDDLDGSQAMAAAAYNAGPSRPRRWRDGATLEAAAWAENIPFNETRDYVKKVLSNAVIYSHLLGRERPAALSARLGPAIGPRELAATLVNTDLP